jgi:tyrosyl-tRNA synthetase
MAAPATTTWTAEERLAALRDSAEECLGKDDLPRLLRYNPRPVCLDGFEPSGAITIAQGVGTAIRARAMVRAGCRVKLLLADCFALLNKRLDGDPARIWAAARRMVEVWRALGVGVDGGGGVEILWSSEEIIRRSHEYWSPLVMDIAQRNSVKRIRGYACTPRARSFVYQKFKINLYSEILMVMHMLHRLQVLHFFGQRKERGTHCWPVLVPHHAVC